MSHVNTRAENVWSFQEFVEDDNEFIDIYEMHLLSISGTYRVHSSDTSFCFSLLRRPEESVRKNVVGLRRLPNDENGYSLGNEGVDYRKVSCQEPNRQMRTDLYTAFLNSSLH
jgi:hypothetical protein